MVAGEGPMPAKGLIVGEAPGREEVEQGRPFVGKSGKLLDTVLRSCGVDRAEIFVTNVVKELPLDSDGKIRKPYPEEVLLWSAILDGEIQETAPKAILALGRTAVDAVTGLERVPFGSKIETCFTAWHPSFVLRQGGGGFTLYDRSAYAEWMEQIKPWAEALNDD